MSRSMRHTPIIPATNKDTEKKDKQLAHQRERKWLHDHLNVQTATVEDFEIDVFHHHPREGRELFAKDGKQFIGSRAKYVDAHLLRK
jgi:hypothetical protein